MSNWITRAARKQSLKQFIAALIILGIVGMIFAANADYVREYFRGPHRITAQDLITGGRSTAGWVNLKADKLHNTGLQEITVRKKRGVERGRSVTAVYHIAEVGEKLLLVKGTENQASDLQGTFIPLDSGISEQIFKEPRMQAMRSQFYPAVLDARDYDSEASTWLPVGGIVALGALVWGGIGFMRWRKPEKHPAVKRLLDDNTLVEADRSIRRDHERSKLLKLGGTTLTREYAITQSLFKLDIKPLSDLLWSYMQVTQKKLYYVIPAGKTYAASLNFSKGSLALSGKEEKVDAVLEHLGDYAPWAIQGHNAQLDHVYKKQRNEMSTAVKQRYEETIQARKQDAATQAEAMDTLAKKATSS